MEDKITISREEFNGLVRKVTKQHRASLESTMLPAVFSICASVMERFAGSLESADTGATSAVAHAVAKDTLRQTAAIARDHAAWLRAEGDKAGG